MGTTPGRDELEAGREGRGTPRTRLWWLAAVVAAVAGLTLARPDLSLHADRPSPPPPTPSPSADRPDVLRAEVSWSPRGDLVDHEGFARAALGRMSEERPELSRMLYVGALPDGSRLALGGSYVGRGVVAMAVHALVAVPGAGVAEAPVTEAMALTDGNQVFGWAGRGVDGRVQAVFLTRPGPTTFAFSPRVEYDEGGRPSRTWSQQRSADGSLVVDLGADADPVVAVRAVGPGAFTVPEVVRVAPSATRASPTSALRVSPLVVRGSGDRSYAGPERRLLDRALRAGVGNLADLQASRLRVLWSGAPWKQRRLALVLVTRPDGVRLHALVGEYRGSEFTAGVRALPTADPDEVPFLLEPFSPEDPTYLLCPTGAGSVVYRRTGNPDRRLTVSETGALALIPPGPSPPTARGAEVSVHDPAGRHLLTARLPRQGTDDPLALFDPPS